ncbi:IS1634 family transposase [Emticicia sp. 21SJ11W-3]|uniref:IS1634 family transposase n=1 Tax=Emticicia sp. 21SJ11W-3 TaxID=2916755 RepID=UPI0020A00C31|nr:IS1634 family transposase [Emticicia sp. 21SJ11W-3]UTA68585.1 IS1634 family transposase [Emticicia sp. 21SJ11W-3]
MEKLFEEGKQFVLQYGGQQFLSFENETALVAEYFQALQSFHLVGPELIVGKIFDDIGFGVIKDALFRELVITRLVYPVSKLKTTEYLYRYKNEMVDVERIYRYLDKLHHKQKNKIQEISYAHTLKVLHGQINIVFYDVTTLYFESEQGDELRVTGFSKEGKHQHPQIILGLLISVGGYPLAYEVFEGNKFEGHTLLPVLDRFKEKYKLDKLVVVADAGLLSTNNMELLQQKGYEYILGARIKTESPTIKNRILALGLQNGESAFIEKSANVKLLVSYSDARSKKDAHNRKRGLDKLEKQIKSGKLTKTSINNRGYNKYLKLEGSIQISIDKEKYSADSLWDGLKGYMTNTKLSKDEVIENYGYLWQIERAFRISKTDLRIRPIYHRIQHRIEAHICIAFCAYKVFKELERQLKQKQSEWSVEQALEITKTIYQVSFKTQLSQTIHSRIYISKPEQEKLLNLFHINFG